MKKFLVNLICAFIPLKKWRKYVRSTIFKFNDVFTKDTITFKKNNYWSFPVCYYNHRLDDNLRAIFDKVKNDKQIKKIILTRDKQIVLDGENIVVVPLKSKEGLKYLMQSKVIFLKHSFRANVGYNLNVSKRLVVNLWHGSPFKKIGVATTKTKAELKLFIEHGTLAQSKSIASSLVDKMAMSAAMFPLTYNDIWLTGLPRHDYILMPEQNLPNDFKYELREIKNLKKDKKLVLYAPTFRDGQKKAAFKFSSEQIIKLRDLLIKNNAILGIREHMADTSHSYLDQLSSLCPIDMNQYSSVEMIYRNTDVLITDYSSCFIDFMLTNRPVVNFSYDYKNYAEHERGFFYEIEDVFPSRINKSFDSMIESLEQSFSGQTNAQKQHYENCKKHFLKYRDDLNSDRVIQKIKKELYG